MRTTDPALTKWSRPNKFNRIGWFFRNEFGSSSAQCPAQTSVHCRQQTIRALVLRSDEGRFVFGHWQSKNFLLFGLIRRERTEGGRGNCDRDQSGTDQCADPRSPRFRRKQIRLPVHVAIPKVDFSHKRPRSIVYKSVPQSRTRRAKRRGVVTRFTLRFQMGTGLIEYFCRRIYWFGNLC